MAFSFKKMFNINYFKKADEFVPKKDEDETFYNLQSPSDNSTNHENYGSFGNDSPSLNSTMFDSAPSIIRDQLETPLETCHVKTLKLDISRPISNNSYNIHLDENTPKHILLETSSNNLFRERLREMELDRSFGISQDDMDQSTLDDVNLSMSRTDSEVSILSDIEDERYVKMCWKVENGEGIVVDRPNKSKDSFYALDLEKNENLVSNSLDNLVKLSSNLECILTDLSLHIQSQGGDCKPTSVIIASSSCLSHIASASDSWNFVEKDDTNTRIQRQLSSMKHTIDKFVQKNLTKKTNFSKSKARAHKKMKSHKKRNKVFDFPDYREELLNLFASHDATKELDDTEIKCTCLCHNMSQADSGLETSKSTIQTVSSSIGNFTLDNPTLSAYSESLELDCRSCQESSFRALLQHKSAVDRITFYIQAHSIQITSHPNDQDYESKTIITFFCTACDHSEIEEGSLLKHILTQTHSERIHFLYKTAYINKCLRENKEIQPSTVLNPMVMYRDDNKVVCFGDFVYACTLCFQSNIVGESVLMSHCHDPDHVSRRNVLFELLD